MPVAPDLPEKYYLDNFYFVLNHVAQLYADIINEDERTFYVACSVAVGTGSGVTNWRTQKSPISLPQQSNYSASVFSKSMTFSRADCPRKMTG